ncbi:hypothetical protein CBF27_05970 [Vagococcus acidifermentans]|uniref:Uncharacterized protein n=1 Tax=Vagococcus acidifermentans TaxID=564710 RepID=A0A430AWT6_9ENTE|nr:hypothetical protein CBF27_05970 [Vagococcus acidifermentans]
MNYNGRNFIRCLSCLKNVMFTWFLFVGAIVSFQFVVGINPAILNENLWLFMLGTSIVANIVTAIRKYKGKVYR